MQEITLKFNILLYCLTQLKYAVTIFRDLFYYCEIEIITEIIIIIYYYYY